MDLACLLLPKEEIPGVGTVTGFVVVLAFQVSSKCERYTNMDEDQRGAYLGIIARMKLGNSLFDESPISSSYRVIKGPSRS